MINVHTKTYDVAIIGGGAAGMMAALSVRHHHPDYSVCILERSGEVGRKLTISGAGRGNLTNIHIAHNPSSGYFGNSGLVSSVFSQFGYDACVAFFNDIGIPLFEEMKSGRGKLFPVIENARTVRNVLVETMKENDISVFFDANVTDIRRDNGLWNTKTQGSSYQARYLIVTTGGKTYPAFGSDGSGYALLQNLGHTIVTPVPSAVPLVSKNPLSHLLQGEKMVMKATVILSGKRVASSVGDVIFTQYGLSGSAILDISRAVSIRINREGKTDTEVELSFFPEDSRGETEQLLKKRFLSHPDRTVPACLWGLLTVKGANAVCEVSGIPKGKLARDVSPDDMVRIVSVLTAYHISVAQTRGWNEAEFTAGGVDANEINPRTLASKKAENLYVAGEILDVDGPVGGYNLSWAWASGFVAGKLS